MCHCPNIPCWTGLSTPSCFVFNQMLIICPSTIVYSGLCLCFKAVERRTYDAELKAEHNRLEREFVQQARIIEQTERSEQVGGVYQIYLKMFISFFGDIHVCMSRLPSTICLLFIGFVGVFLYIYIFVACSHGQISP